MATTFALSQVRRAQHGVSLLFSMMTLVVLTLAAVALVRSVDLGTLIVGNLGFKQDATAASGAATAQALTWLDNRIAAGSSMDDDIPASGYYANSRDKLDPTGRTTTAANQLAVVDWLGDNTCSYLPASEFSSCTQAVLGAPVHGYEVRWVITRLCKNSAAISPTNPCSKPVATSVSTASERGELAAGGRITAATASPYYRVIVRVLGPRNTVSYTESLVHF